MKIITRFDLASKSTSELHALHRDALKAFTAAARQARASRRARNTRQYRNRDSGSPGTVGQPAYSCVTSPVAVISNTGSTSS